MMMTSNRDAAKRPDSSQLADLHIYILPKNFWKNNQNLAFNEAIKESVSLGFIRVKREAKIAELRSELPQQCAPADLPREYIFLKSVGRALTRVRAKQEQELKVKNFIPPQTLNPEIFLLEGRHEDFKNTPTTYRVGDLGPFGLNDNDSNIYDPFNSTESPFAFTKNIDPSSNDDYDEPHSRKNASRRTIQFVDPELEKLKDLNMLKEEQERLKNRQAELENMRNRQLELDQQKKQQQQQQQDAERRKREAAEEEERRRRREREQAEEEEKRRRREEEEERRRRREAEEEDRRRKREAEDEERRRREAEQRRIEEEKQRQRDLEDSATKIQSTVRGHKDRQKVSQKITNLDSSKRNRRKKKFSQANSRLPSKNPAPPLCQMKKVEGLKEQLEATRRKRNELELLRDELIRHLKLIHSRITIRRKEARDLWKKKYFAEKKKTPALEEKIQSQLSEIDSLQKKMFNNLETDVRNAALGGYVQESEIRNNYLTSLKLQEEIYSYKRQVDQAKLKLTTDIKLRNQAETESKALRTELHQTKSNMNQLKNHSLQSF